MLNDRIDNHGSLFYCAHGTGDDNFIYNGANADCDADALTLTQTLRDAIPKFSSSKYCFCDLARTTPLSGDYSSGYFGLVGCSDLITDFNDFVRQADPCWFSGIKVESDRVSVSSLINCGWKLAYQKLYSHDTEEEELSALQGTRVLVAARKTGADILSLAAIGDRNEVLKQTSSTTEAHENNGVYWYFQTLWMAKGLGFRQAAQLI